jgi:hypothetical protein
LPLNAPIAFESFVSEKLKALNTNRPVARCLIDSDPAHSSKSRRTPANPPPPFSRRSSAILA